MTWPGSKEQSEFGPNGSSRRCTGQNYHGSRIQAKSRQECADDPDESWTHREERVKLTGVAIETRTTRQDPRRPSETSTEGSRPRQGNQTGHRAGARVQMLPWQDHPGPYDNIIDRSWLHYVEPRGYDFGAGVQKLSWQDHPGPFENVPDKDRPNTERE